MLIADRETPLAGDGRLDVYTALAGLGRSAAEIAPLCKSHRVGRGPTPMQVRSGDYAGFPWERHRGKWDRLSLRSIPLLWEARPGPRGQHLVAFQSGATRYVESGELDALLRAAGQRDN